MMATIHNTESNLSVVFRSRIDWMMLSRARVEHAVTEIYGFGDYGCALLAELETFKILTPTCPAPHHISPRW
jgi:hypothetical protein